MESSYSKRRRLPHSDKPWVINYVTIATRSRRKLSPDARAAVLSAIRHFHGRRYDLFAVCVMPDHVHFLLQPWFKEQPIVENPWRANLVGPEAEYPWVWTPDLDTTRSAPEVPGKMPGTAGGTPALPGN